MGEAVERLTRLVETEDRYNIAAADLSKAQIAAMNERFQERKGQIKLLGYRAKEAGITEVRSREEVVQLLLPHTAYKSYPESLLAQKRWDRLSKWLDTVSTHRVPVDKVSDAGEVDDWIEKLSANGFFVSCSSGTTGKSAMLVASQKDMDWCKKEAVAAYSWGSGVKATRDRRIFGMAPIAQVPRNLATGEAYTAMLQDPNYERFVYPVPPITVGALTQMVVLRKAIADGTAKPQDIATYDEVSAARQKAVDAAVGITARAVVEARRSKLHVSGLWAGSKRRQGRAGNGLQRQGFQSRELDLRRRRPEARQAAGRLPRVRL